MQSPPKAVLIHRVDYQLNRWRSLRFALTVLGGMWRSIITDAKMLLCGDRSSTEPAFLEIDIEIDPF